MSGVKLYIFPALLLVVFDVFYLSFLTCFTVISYLAFGIQRFNSVLIHESFVSADEEPHL